MHFDAGGVMELSRGSSAAKTPGEPPKRIPAPVGAVEALGQGTTMKKQAVPHASLRAFESQYTKAPTESAMAAARSFCSLRLTTKASATIVPRMGTIRPG